MTEKMLRKQTGEALGVDLGERKAQIRSLVRCRGAQCVLPCQ